MGSFLKQFYAGTPFIPREIMLPCEVEDEQVVSRLACLPSVAGRFTSGCRKKEPRKSLVELAEKNAAMVLSQDKDRMKQRRRTDHRSHEGDR